VTKPRAVLNLDHTQYYTQTRPPFEWYWTRSSPKHRYIHKGGCNLGTLVEPVIQAHIKP